jgi:hypothetical protein
LELDPNIGVMSNGYTASGFGFNKFLSTIFPGGGKLANREKR